MATKDKTTDLRARTLAEKPETLADMQTGLGKPAARIPAKRGAALAAASDPQVMQQHVLQRLNSDLTSGGQPTLAQRVAREGVAAYGGDFKNSKRPKPKGKPHAR